MITTQNPFSSSCALQVGQPCPCGREKTFGQCCNPLLEHRQKADTAEDLMRSRFSAFVTENWQYLCDTATEHNGPTEIKNYSNRKTWCSLKIVKTSLGQHKDSTGEVEFVAFYLQLDAGKKTLLQHHEHSYFIKSDDCWRFSRGETLEPIKIERNSPCPCLSGKKYKKCCCD